MIFYDIFKTTAFSCDTEIIIYVMSGIILLCGLLKGMLELVMQIVQKF